MRLKTILHYSSMSTQQSLGSLGSFCFFAFFFPLFLFKFFSELCPFILCLFLLSQHTSPELLYFCFKLFSYRGDLLVIQVILNYSTVFAVFICSMEAYFIPYLLFVFPVPFHLLFSYITLSLLCCFLLSLCVYCLFFNAMSSSWKNYLRRFILVIDQGSVSA